MFTYSKTTRSKVLPCWSCLKFGQGHDWSEVTLWIKPQRSRCSHIYHAVIFIKRMLSYYAPHKRSAPPRTEQRKQPEARSRLWSRDHVPPPPTDYIRWTSAVIQRMRFIQISDPNVVSGYSNSYCRNYARQKASSCVWEFHHQDWSESWLGRAGHGNSDEREKKHLTHWEGWLVRWNQRWQGS